LKIFIEGPEAEALRAISSCSSRFFQKDIAQTIQTQSSISKFKSLETNVMRR
jgi:hypothetical protein